LTKCVKLGPEVSHVKARHQISHRFGPDEAIGPGKISLLEHIDSSGSISQAARDLGMSYRRGWQLVVSLNQSFEEPLITASTGGRAGRRDPDAFGPRGDPSLSSL